MSTVLFGFFKKSEKSFLNKNRIFFWTKQIIPFVSTVPREIYLLSQSPRGEGLIFSVFLFVLCLSPLFIIYEKSSSDIYHQKHDSHHISFSFCLSVRLALWTFVQKWNPQQNFQRPMLTTHRQSTGIFLIQTKKKIKN